MIPSISGGGEIEPGFEMDPSDFELSEFVVISSSSGVVVQCELEVAEVDALFGVKPWRTFTAAGQRRCHG